MSSKPRRRVTVDTGDEKKPSVFSRLGPGGGQRKYDVEGDRGDGIYEQKCRNWLLTGDCKYRKTCKFRHGPFTGGPSKRHDDSSDDQRRSHRDRRASSSESESGRDKGHSHSRKEKEMRMKSTIVHVKKLFSKNAESDRESLTSEEELEKKRRQIQQELSRLDEVESESIVVERKLVPFSSSSSSCSSSSESSSSDNDSSSESSPERSRKKSKKSKSRKKDRKKRKKDRNKGPCSPSPDLKLKEKQKPEGFKMEIGSKSKHKKSKSRPMEKNKAFSSDSDTSANASPVKSKKSPLMSPIKPDKPGSQGRKKMFLPGDDDMPSPGDKLKQILQQKQAHSIQESPVKKHRTPEKEERQESSKRSKDKKKSKKKAERGTSSGDERRHSLYEDIPEPHKKSKKHHSKEKHRDRDSTEKPAKRKRVSSPEHKHKHRDPSPEPQPAPRWLEDRNEENDRSERLRQIAEEPRHRGRESRGEKMRSASPERRDKFEHDRMERRGDMEQRFEGRDRSPGRFDDRDHRRRGRSPGDGQRPAFDHGDDRRRSDVREPGRRPHSAERSPPRMERDMVEFDRSHSRERGRGEIFERDRGFPDMGEKRERFDESGERFPGFDERDRFPPERRGGPFEGREFFDPRGEPRPGDPRMPPRDLRESDFRRDRGGPDRFGEGRRDPRFMEGRGAPPPPFGPEFRDPSWERGGFGRGIGRDFEGPRDPRGRFDDRFGPRRGGRFDHPADRQSRRQKFEQGRENEFYIPNRDNWPERPEERRDRVDDRRDRIDDRRDRSDDRRDCSNDRRDRLRDGDLPREDNQDDRPDWRDKDHRGGRRDDRLADGRRSDRPDREIKDRGHRDDKSLDRSDEKQRVRSGDRSEEKRDQQDNSADRSDERRDRLTAKGELRDEKPPDTTEVSRDDRDEKRHSRTEHISKDKKSSDAIVSPSRQGLSPSGRKITSPKPSRSPSGLGRSPGFRKSPTLQNRSPIRRSKSPKHYSKSPIRRSKSPAGRNKSPLRRSKSPDLSRSPAVIKSPSKRDVSPSYQNKSPSKRNKSPTRSKSPSRRKDRKDHDLITEQREKETKDRQSLDRTIKSDRLSIRSEGSTERQTETKTDSRDKGRDRSTRYRDRADRPDDSSSRRRDRDRDSNRSSDRDRRNLSRRRRSRSHSSRRTKKVSPAPSNHSRTSQGSHHSKPRHEEIMVDKIVIKEDPDVTTDALPLEEIPTEQTVDEEKDSPDSPQKAIETEAPDITLQIRERLIQTRVDDDGRSFHSEGSHRHLKRSRSRSSSLSLKRPDDKKKLRLASDGDIVDLKDISEIEQTDKAESDKLDDSREVYSDFSEDADEVLLTLEPQAESNSIKSISKEGSLERDLEVDGKLSEVSSEKPEKAEEIEKPPELKENRTERSDERRERHGDQRDRRRDRSADRDRHGDRPERSYDSTRDRYEQRDRYGDKNDKDRYGDRRRDRRNDRYRDERESDRYGDRYGDRHGDDRHKSKQTPAEAEQDDKAQTQKDSAEEGNNLEAELEDISSGEEDFMLDNEQLKELEEQKESKPSIVDILDIDWEFDSRPKPAVVTSGLQKYRAAAIFSEIGVSRQYAGDKLFEKVKNVCQKQLMDDAIKEEKLRAAKYEASKEKDGNPEKDFIQPEISPEIKAKKFELYHDVASFHSSIAKRIAERTNLLRNVGPFRRALCARRDLEIRRQLCKVDKAMDQGQAYPSTLADSDLCKLSIELFKKAQEA